MIGGFWMKKKKARSNTLFGSGLSIPVSYLKANASVPQNDCEIKFFRKIIIYLDNIYKELYNLVIER